MYQIQHVIFRRDIMIELPHGHTACLGYHANGRWVISLLEKYSAGTLHNLLMFLLNEMNISRWGKRHIFVGSLDLTIFVWRGHIEFIEQALDPFQLSNSLFFVKHFLKSAPWFEETCSDLSFSFRSSDWNCQQGDSKTRKPFDHAALPWNRGWRWGDEVDWQSLWLVNWKGVRPPDPHPFSDEKSDNIMFKP